MLKRYLKTLNEQSEQVFGVKPKKALSLYSIFAIASLVLPIAALITVLIMKLF